MRRKKGLFPLDPDRLACVRERIHGWAERAGMVDASAPYRSRATAQEQLLPTLHLEDVSGIPFLDGITGIEHYQHRARVRADSGDLVAAVPPAPEGYEDYCRDILGLGSPEIVRAEPVEGAIAVSRACAAGAAFDQIVAWARRHPIVQVHPYMAIDSVWELAERIEQTSGTPVRVVGPPPPVLWAANDKSTFTDLVSLAVGEAWAVETARAMDPTEIARHLADLAGRHEQVGLKRTRCASAMGNRVLDGATVRGWSQERVRDEVDDFLRHTKWRGDEPVLVVEWVDAAHSPSTQLWIPPEGQGPPVLEGVYEQMLVGVERVFEGSRPSTLPARLNRAIGEASLRLAAAFQALGYVGRCSFDLIVSGDPEADFHAQFTECNGRWGGTSTPMSLVDRVIPGPRPAYVAQDFVREALIGIPFADILEALGDDVYDPRRGSGRFLLYNPGPLAHYGKFDVISLGETAADAADGVRRILPGRLGLERGRRD